MGKGKKKAKGKKSSGGKKISEETSVGNSSTTLQITSEQCERARSAAANRTEDPLKNWTRLQNEECPICMVPLSHEASDFNYCVTCGKTVCWGCILCVIDTHIKDCRGEETAVSQAAMEKFLTCAYCRSSTVNDDDKATLEKEMKRANAGNGETMCRVAGYYFDGEMGLRQDKTEALKWYHRAVDVGEGRAADDLGQCYLKGDGVEQDIEKALEHYQKAVDLGWIPAFITIGGLLFQRGEIYEGMLNYRKAAMCGWTSDSLFKAIRFGFTNGWITKEEYAFTLREHQKACNEMKSESREEYKSFSRCLIKVEAQRGENMGNF